MPRFAAVSRERHDQKRWRHFSGYAFAAADAMAPVVGAELAKVALSTPCAFWEQSGRYTLVAVLSLVPGHNMFVAPDGRWLGPYVPVWFRFHPFCVRPQQGTDQLVLCVDEDSGLVVEHNAAGEAFFGAAGNYAPALKSVFEILAEVERSRRRTDLAVAALAQAGVIRPWQITLKTVRGEQAVSGFHRIDESALAALPDDVFLKLRGASALPIAHAQMLSTGQIGVIEQMARLHNQPVPAAVALPETLDGLLGAFGDDIVRFT